MGLIYGTNCGFVTETPVDDPTVTATTLDGHAIAIKAVAPAGATRITEIGWWHDYNANAGNFEVGLYSHDAGSDIPDTRLYVDNTNARTLAEGWDSVEVDWEITEGTTYWIAIQCDSVGGYVKTDYQNDGINRRSLDINTVSLPETWSADVTNDYAIAIYAVYDSGGEEYVDVAGTIIGTSSLSGALTIGNIVDLSGTIIGISSLSGSLYFSIAPAIWPRTRSSDYAPDLYWDEETETWVTSRVTGPGSLIDYVVFVGEEGEIYFGSV